CQTTGEGGNWQARLLADDGSRFEVWLDGQLQGIAVWSQTGAHSVANALTALAAARHVGVTPQQGIAALAGFASPKRRMEKLIDINDIVLYDDFAHHPTAIATTLAGLRASIGDERLVAIIEPRSNTMRLGSHMAALAPSVAHASEVVWYQPPGLDWSLDTVVADSPVPARVATDIDAVVDQGVGAAEPGTRIVIMSNGGFGGIHQKMKQALEARHGCAACHPGVHRRFRFAIRAASAGMSGACGCGGVLPHLPGSAAGDGHRDRPAVAAQAPGDGSLSHRALSGQARADSRVRQAGLDVPGGLRFRCAFGHGGMPVQYRYAVGHCHGGQQ